MRNLSRVDEIEDLKVGDNIMMDSIGPVFYTGYIDGKLEFAFLHYSGYIFAFRGKKEDAMLRNSYSLDFNELECKVYSSVLNPSDYKRCIDSIGRKEKIA